MKREYRGGTNDFDEIGWNNYVDTHRQADPDLSDRGHEQATKLADFLVPHVTNQASSPVRIITSPMKRTLQTIRPTLEQLQQQQYGMNDGSGSQMFGNDHLDQQGNPNFQSSDFHDSSNM